MPDVKIKGYSGAYLEYKDVPKVYLAALESTDENPILVPFSYGDVVEGTEIIPDFTAGDMTVSVPEGYLVKSAVIKKPETLLPENIAKDVEIAGITGTHEGGGGSADTEDIDTFLDQINGEIIGETLYTVTFVYGNKTYQESVYEGRDCPDPVAAGLIESPTKESTRYTNYIFNGWSLTNGGEAESDALIGIESNRTVYAAFREELIYIAKGACGSTTTWRLNPDYVLTIDGTGAINNGEAYDVLVINNSITNDNRPWKAFVEQITEVVIMPGIYKICGNAFQRCSALISISLPEGITEIHMGAFKSCTGLRSVTIPTTMLYIYGEAFRLTGIRSITLPYGMRSFERSAFDYSELDSFIFSRTDGWRYGAQLYSETNYTELTPEEAADSATVLERMRGSNTQYWWNEKWKEDVT